MRKLDWPIIIQRIKKAGVKPAEIASETETSQDMIYKVSVETLGAPQQWDQAIALLDLYLRATNNRPLPFYGEHNDV